MTDFVINCKTYQVNATTGANFDTPVRDDASFNRSRKINGNGGMAVQGGSGATFNGDVTQIGGNITTDGDVNM